MAELAESCKNLSVELDFDESAVRRGAPGADGEWRLYVPMSDIPIDQMDTYPAVCEAVAKWKAEHGK